MSDEQNDIVQQVADLIRENVELRTEIERLRKLVEAECDKCF